MDGSVTVSELAKVAHNHPCDIKAADETPPAANVITAKQITLNVISSIEQMAVASLLGKKMEAQTLRNMITVQHFDTVKDASFNTQADEKLMNAYRTARHRLSARIDDCSKFVEAAQRDAADGGYFYHEKDPVTHRFRWCLAANADQVHEARARKDVVCVVRIEDELWSTLYVHLLCVTRC